MFDDVSDGTAVAAPQNDDVISDSEESDVESEEEDEDFSSYSHGNSLANSKGGTKVKGIDIDNVSIYIQGFIKAF